jgi:hypothetical protein
MYQDGQKTSEQQMNFEPTALAASKVLIAVGGNDNVVRLSLLEHSGACY